MNAFGKHSENTARFALRLQRGNGDHRGKENGVTSVPAQEEKYFVPLRMDAIDAPDPENVSAHYGERDPLRANEVDADENNGSHGLVGGRIQIERCAVHHCQSAALRDRVINVVVVQSDGQQRIAAADLVEINAQRLWQSQGNI